MKRVDTYDGYSEESKAYFEALDYVYDSLPAPKPRPPRKQSFLRRAWLYLKKRWWSDVWDLHRDPGGRCTWWRHGSCDACDAYRRVIDDIKAEMVSPDYPQARLH